MSNLNRLGEGFWQYGVTGIAGGVGGFVAARELEGILFPDFTGHYEQLAGTADQAEQALHNTWQEYSAMPRGKAADQVHARYSEQLVAYQAIRDEANGAQEAQIAYEGGGIVAGAILSLALLSLGKTVARRIRERSAPNS